MEPNRSPTPHDRLAKSVLSRTNGAAALLRACLPAAIIDRLDLSTLSFEPTELIGTNLTLGIADILATIRGKDRAENFILAVALIEHLSEPYKFAVAELFCDVGRIWSPILASRTAGTRLPFVIPIVVHNGPGGWRGPKTLFDLLSGGEEAAFGVFVPTLPVQWVDLARRDESFFTSVAVNDPILGAAFRLMRWARTTHAFDQLMRTTDLLELVLHLPDGGTAFEQLVSYYLSVNERSRRHGVAVGVDRVLAELRSRLSQPAEVIMNTLADELIQRGIEKGVEKGVETVLRARFGDIPDSLLDAIHRQRDATSATRLLTIAAKCASLDDFRAALSE